MESPTSNKALYKDRRLNHKFEQALDLTIEKCIHYIKFSLFKEKFPEIHKKAQPCLLRIHQQLQMHLKTQMKEYALALYTKHKVPYLLHSFEKIVCWLQKGNSDKLLWVQTDSTTKDYPSSKVEYKDKLRLYLQKLSSENDSAENVMFKRHEEILELKEHIVDLEQDVCELLDDLKDSSSCKGEGISFQMNLDDSNDIT